MALGLSAHSYAQHEVLLYRTTPCDSDSPDDCTLHELVILLRYFGLVKLRLKTLA